MSRLAEDFRNYLRIERGMSPNTVASYARDVEGLLTAYKGYRPSDIGTAEVEQYLSKRIQKGLSKRSQARMLSSFRSFFNWCIEEGDLKDNPCDRIRRHHLLGGHPEPGRPAESRHPGGPVRMRPPRE